MKNNLVWMRRDLRLHDHHALSKALNNNNKTYLLFIFDENILNKLPKNDRRITFIIESLIDIEKKLNQYNSSLIIRFGKPAEEIEKVVTEFNIESIYFNRDYEPYAKKRDEFVEKYLLKKNINVHHFKDHVFFEKHEVTTDKREIYKVFTPYKNKWLYHFENFNNEISPYPIRLQNLAHFKNNFSIINQNWYEKIHFLKTENVINGGESEAEKCLKAFKESLHEYNIARDFPALEKTSGLSPYIRMGNISIREMIKLSVSEKNIGAQTWLAEIIWRDFYHMILDVFPKVENHSFKSQYENLNYENNEGLFKKWCEGQTGYPIIDAAMRCLNQTGLLHNRLRMVVASFLTKTLLIDWRKGEAYFALKLLDFDMAANNGGWQWSSSTGVDATPYFRIFNPYSQSEKFDSNGDFIKLYCPELRLFDKKAIHQPHETEIFEQAKAQCVIGSDYPAPIVNYRIQREKALKMFKSLEN